MPVGSAFTPANKDTNYYISVSKPAYTGGTQTSYHKSNATIDVSRFGGEQIVAVAVRTHTDTISEVSESILVMMSASEPVPPA